VRDLLGVLVLGFTSALFPLINIEAILGVRAAVAEVEGIWLLAFIAAVGQMVGKIIWYYLGASALHWGWIRRKVEQPKNAARLEVWRERTHDRPFVASALVFVSAVSGLPPFAILSVLAGQLRMNLLLFCVIGLVGRWLRFVVVLGGAEWLSGYLR
jgi:membrane protein YqaA with SNARE-associated domain